MTRTPSDMGARTHNQTKPMKEMKQIEDVRALREARALHEKQPELLRQHCLSLGAEIQRLKLEKQRLRRELRAANRGNERLSLAIKAGRALAKAQDTVAEMGAQRIGIDMAADCSYQLYITVAGGVGALRGPDGNWSRGWEKQMLLMTNIGTAAEANQIARDFSATSGIPCVGDCERRDRNERRI